MDVRHSHVASPVGDLLLIAHDGALAGLYFPGYRYTPPESAWGRAVDAGTDPVLGQARRELGEYFAGNRQVFDVPAVTHGDPFQERVWARLRQIPFGARITYGDIAAELGEEGLAQARAAGLGDKGLAQAVGQAVGRNPVSIAIPCHRVVGAGGKLTGFGGGLPRKQALLDLEAPAEASVAASAPEPAGPGHLF
ncbi:methylated-DNA--[protein]-cysteine S-methyltransferase [Streptomyces sp. NPDC093252]|uniref:methylated-DNA--[protein]-cysteine S-methyltransferase n=1 Tax=Streptomyces sp. NPDC093252 TaxID=3154980 RepID=UPI0034439D37